MMINNISPDAKRPRTDADGVAGPGGDVRKEGRVQTLLSAGASSLSAPAQAAAVNGGRGYAGAKKPVFLSESACR